MPKGKSKTQRKRFKRVKRTKKIVNTSTVSLLPLKGTCPFPRKLLCKLRYADQYPYSVSAGQVSYDNIFRLNSLYDVDLTASGHQPRYYDELAQIYNRYRVLGIRMKATVLTTNPTLPNQNLYMAFIPNSTSSALTGLTPANIREQPMCKSKIMNLYGRNSPATLSVYYPIKKILGVKSVMYENDYASSINTSPTKQAYGHLVVGTADGTTNTWSAQVLVEFEFVVQFEELNTPPVS